MDVRLDGKMLEEVESFKYLGSHIAVNGRVNMEVGHRMKGWHEGCWVTELWG